MSFCGDESEGTSLLMGLTLDFEDARGELFRPAHRYGTLLGPDLALDGALARTTGRPVVAGVGVS
jgi:hypothetical protein